MRRIYAPDLPLPVQLVDRVPFDILSRVPRLVYAALLRYVYLFPPSLQWVPWPPLAGALRFATFNGTMGSYDCSPTRPGRLRSPLATGTPRRGFVRFPWDALVSLGTWFSSGWAEPRPIRGEVESSPGFTGIPFESMPLASDSGDSIATSRYRLPGCCLPPGKRRRRHDGGRCRS